MTALNEGVDEYQNQSCERLPTASEVFTARHRIGSWVRDTPLVRSHFLSDLFQADIFLKREDLQRNRSFKIRGALNRMMLLTGIEKSRGVVCASAGNHAQGVAFACEQLRIQGIIYMPVTTPELKVARVRKLGGLWVKVILTGTTFDETYESAFQHARNSGGVVIHPFDDVDVIAGQGTVGLEILGKMRQSVDYLFSPVGGGGLMAGLATVFQEKSPYTRLVGVEPAKAASMHASLNAGRRLRLEKIDPFVDGAATKSVGQLPFTICQQARIKSIVVDDQTLCQGLVDLYQEEGIVAELAGCLSIAGLGQYREEIVGKTVVCLVSGGNNDIRRTGEILKRGGIA